MRAAQEPPPIALEEVLVTLTPKFSLVSDTAADQPAIGDQTSSDVRLTAADRQFVTQLLERLDERLSVEELMYLAGGAEYLAQRRRAGERCR